MTVYVDDMYATFGRMKMCHMVADSTDELNAMADKIGVARKWIQKPGTPGEHYDVSISARTKAVAFGAVELTTRELARKVWIPRQEAARAQRDPDAGGAGGE